MSESITQSPSPLMKPVAVIEMGTTSIRMALAEVTEAGDIHHLESLQQTVSLGKDTFTEGSIDPDTTEECVKVLRSFRQILQEYQVPTDRVMAVATSAVREASNRDTFLDRLYIATGIEVRVIDETEVNRYTYLAVEPMIHDDKVLAASDTMVVEVGGGNTELLEFHQGQVANSHTYRLGSLRLRNMLEEYHAPMVRLLRIMQNQIDRTVAQVCQAATASGACRLVALGGDIRFAATKLLEEKDFEMPVRLTVSALAAFSKKVLSMSVDDTVKTYHLSYPDAETLGPSLLTYVRLARALKVREIIVGGATLREGLLSEMATHGSWTDDFQRQVISSAVEVGAKYDFDRAHADTVAAIANQLFAALQDEHQLEPRYRLILTVAALLHEIGEYINNRAHHKHAMYLILNSDIFGLGADDLLLTALTARYHRRAMPKPTHEYYQALDRKERVAVCKMAAILRVADALSRGRTQAPELKISVEPRTVTIAVAHAGDLALEQHALRRKGDMFERTYGMQVIFRRWRRRTDRGTAR